ncbi:MAG: ribosomal-processing cysteine protease Prp [Mycoplasmataceae bacterium]|nr:ribosomal-processing cysteine protease Prp [Mycoplasmataceae bacterium]
MVLVNLKYSNNLIKYVEVSGHSEYLSKDGSDLVCASISSIMFGGLNALSQKGLPKKNLIMEDNLIKIINNFKSEVYNNIIDTIYFQLKTIESKYGEHIKIIEKEEENEKL